MEGRRWSDGLHQAVEANKLYKMLDGKLRKQALLREAPDEGEIAFRGTKGQFTGAPVANMARDQKEHLQKILRLLLEPFRQSDQDEAVAALKKNGQDKNTLIIFMTDNGAAGEDVRGAQRPLLLILRLEGADTHDVGADPHVCGMAEAHHVAEAQN